MERACPDCGETSKMQRISLVDQLSGGSGRVGLSFTMGETPKFGAWRGDVRNAAGVIHGYLCSVCRRVLLYAS